MLLVLERLGILVSVLVFFLSFLICVWNVVVELLLKFVV